MADDAASNPSEDVVERIYADGIAMVQLLGPQDRLLRVVEREHRDVQVLSLIHISEPTRPY